MRAPKDRARAALLTLASGLHLAGCGGGGATSSGTFPRVDSISSLRASPTVFTLVGERFQSALGTAVTVVFDADGDGTPFAGGTSPRAEVPGTVTSDSTIAGTSPAAVLGTSTRVDAFVTVRFAGRFESRSASAIAAFEAPVVTGISRPVVDSEIPAAVQVLGGHFGTPGLAATVTFQALSGTPFGGGTTDTLVIPGTVASDEAIGLMSPVAGVSVDTPASIRVEIVDVGRGGSAGALVTFAAPTVTGFGAATVDSENPTAFTVSGTGIAGPLVVRFVAGTGTPFLGQSLATVEAAGAATLGVRVDGVTPRFGASVSTGAGVRLVFASGAVAESGPAIVTIEPPSLADAPLLAVRCEYATPLTIAGVRLGNGLPVLVRFTAGVGTPFVGGTSATVDVAGTATSTTTVAVTSPTAVAGPAAVLATVRVAFASGAETTTPGPAVEFDPPTVGTLLAPTQKVTETAPFRLTGAGFAPVGGTASVRFTASVGTPFAGGTSATATVVCSVASDLSLAGMTPVGTATRDFEAALDVTLASGSRSAGTATLAMRRDSVAYRWQTFNTYDDATGAPLLGGEGALYGGVSPTNWTDGGFTAGNMSTDLGVLGALFRNKGHADRNAMIWSEVETIYSSTNGEIAAALFRVRNTTGSTIAWTPSFYWSAFGSWGEWASVAVDGVNVWTSGGANALAQATVSIPIPPNGTSTVIFTSSLGPPLATAGAVYERAGQLGIFGDGLLLPTGLAFVDDMSTSVPYRWQTFNTYDNAVGWLAGNDPTLYGGVTPQSWTDGNGTAGNLSADPAVLAALFTHVGYAAGNATIWSKVETQQSSTNGEIAAALFRVKNSTASAIPWTARFYYSSYGSWGESASVAVNGVNVFASSANTLFYQTLTISIPAASTATVVFTSALGPAPAVTPDLAQRAGQLGFWGNSLLLPAGLSFVDDLAAPVPFRWQTFDTFDDATGAWLMGNDPAMYGGVSPAAWTDGGATAGSMSSNPTVLATLFTNQGRASRNALIWSEVETVYSSTNGGIGAALFRVRNTTGSAIVWTPSFNYSCHAAWGEVASVALDGVDVWTSAGPGTLGSQTVGLSIPAGGTSTVIFTSTLGPPGGGGTARARGGQLGIVGDGLVLPAGLVFVDDL